MRVKIEVEFEVTSEEEGFTEREAKVAAELAVYHNLSLTENGQDVQEPVKQFVDGFGDCEISIPSS